MIKVLIIDFFNEIEKKELRKNKNAKASFWVEELQKADYNDKNYIGIKKATRLYDKYVEEKKNVSVKNPDKFLCDEMSKYLGYDSFEDYKFSKDSTKSIGAKEKEDKKDYKKITWTLSVVTFIAMVVLIKLNYSSASTCIVWRENHFETTSCNTKNTIDNSIYNINIEKFSKVKVTKNTTFIKNDVPLFWYGKNNNKEMEFFSDRGIHPETLKELKPITETIINNYILIKPEEKTILK